jgi:muconate cycloisomerase
MIRISGFDIVVIEIPLRMRIGPRRAVTHNLLVAAHDESGYRGWGETCPRPEVAGETLERARDTLRADILPGLLGLEFESFDALVDVIGRRLDSLRRDQLAAFCAAEMALLDLAGQISQRSAGDVFGPVSRDLVHYIGEAGALDEDGLRRDLRELRKQGVSQIKIRVTRDLDANLRRLDTARTMLGDDVELRIVADRSWETAEALRQLDAMAGYRLAGVEGALPGEDLEGMCELTAAGLTAVVGGESVASVADARYLIELGACDELNLRLSRCGGLINTRRIHAAARAAGVACQLGAEIDQTGLLSAAGRQFATRAEGARWFEGSREGWLLEESITAPDITTGPGGRARALPGPGLGVTTSAAAVATFTTQRISLRNDTGATPLH